MAQVSYDLDFQIFGTFSIIIQKGILARGGPESKQIEKKNLSRNMFFLRFFA
jgi:hypothetical protein